MKEINVQKLGIEECDDTQSEVNIVSKDKCKRGKEVNFQKDRSNENQRQKRNEGSKKRRKEGRKERRKEARKEGRKEERKE